MVTPKGSMLTEGEILQFSVLPYSCSICPPFVTRQMSNLAILADSKTQKGFLIRCRRHVSSRLPPSGENCKCAMAPSTQKKLGDILYLLIWSFLLCLSWLLPSRVRKFRRNLWITLYNSNEPICKGKEEGTQWEQFYKYRGPKSDQRLLGNVKF
jgi:hypothetical protein